jgi:hypothetical protein
MEYVTAYQSISVCNRNGSKSCSVAKNIILFDLRRSRNDIDRATGKRSIRKKLISPQDQ